MPTQSGRPASVAAAGRPYADRKKLRNSSIKGGVGEV